MLTMLILLYHKEGGERTKISDLGTPDFRMPSPTSFSFPYPLHKKVFGTQFHRAISELHVRCAVYVSVSSFGNSVSNGLDDFLGL